MSNYYYDLCCKHRGKVVHIVEKCGRSHYGRLVNVDNQFVYLEPISMGRDDVFSYGWYSPVYGGYWGRSRYRHGGFVPIALAAIAGFALGSALFWW